MAVILSVDLGTTKLCALALDWPSRRLLAVRHTDNVAALQPGEQNAGTILATALRLLAEVARDPQVQGQTPAAIGVTGQMHGVLLVDEHGRPTTPLVNWQDQRGTEPAPSGSGQTWTQRLARLLGDESPRLTGGRPATGYGGVTLLRWATVNRQALQGCRALSIMDLLVLRLSGRAVTDPSIAASWGLADASRGTWLPDVARRLGLDAHVLPDIAPTASVAGGLLPGVACDLGLPAGLPVAVALGDNQASFLGSVQAIDGTLLINLGTGGQMSLASARYVLPAGLEVRPLAPSRWLLVGASLCGGRAYAALARFYQDLLTRLLGQRVDQAALFGAMNDLALSHLDQTAGLSASTLLSGTRQDPSARGCVSGISEANFAAGPFTAAFVSGIVGELVEFYRQAQAAGIHATRVLGSGNAIRRNPAMQRAIEQQLGMSLLLPDVQEEAAVGAAVIAATAVGLHTLA